MKQPYISHKNNDDNRWNNNHSLQYWPHGQSQTWKLCNVAVQYINTCYIHYCITLQYCKHFLNMSLSLHFPEIRTHFCIIITNIPCVSYQETQHAHTHTHNVLGTEPNKTWTTKLEQKLQTLHTITTKWESYTIHWHTRNHKHSQILFEDILAIFG